MYQEGPGLGSDFNFIKILKVKVHFYSYCRTRLGNNKVSGQLEMFFTGIPQRPLETSPGTIRIVQKRFQGPTARGF